MWPAWWDSRPEQHVLRTGFNHSGRIFRYPGRLYIAAAIGDGRRILRMQNYIENLIIRSLLLYNPRYCPYKKLKKRTTACREGEFREGRSDLLHLFLACFWEHNDKKQRLHLVIQCISRLSCFILDDNWDNLGQLFSCWHCCP